MITLSYVSGLGGFLFFLFFFAHNKYPLVLQSSRVCLSVTPSKVHALSSNYKMPGVPLLNCSERFLKGEPSTVK